MGKKDFILDNGKKAQSSMTLYWKNNKQRSKNPKQKKQIQQNEQQITDKRVLSNFQKWKLHKQKVITKAYTKPTNKQQSVKVQLTKKQEEEEQNYLYQMMMQKKKVKPLSIPGFGSKQALASKIQIQKALQADQSTNILKLPEHMSDLTQDDILQILRQNKNKKQIMKRHTQKIRKNENNENKQSDNQQDVLLGQQFINLMKKKEKDQIKKLKQQQELEKIQANQKQKELFFKSDILNKIQKVGIIRVLQQQTKKQSENKNKQEIEENKKIQQQQKQSILQNQKNQYRKLQIKNQPRFIPRVLKK